MQEKALLDTFRCPNPSFQKLNKKLLIQGNLRQTR